VPRSRFARQLQNDEARMQQLQTTLTSVPTITAIATLAAACIAAVVAIVIAFVNAWSSRRIAIDTAHRAYRTQLADGSLAAMRKLLSQVDELELVSRNRDVDRWREIAADITKRRSLRQDLPYSNDPVFASAVRLFVTRRSHFEMWLSVTTFIPGRRSDMPEFGMTEALKYITEAAQVLETAAEAYVFDLPRVRRRAARLVKEVDDLPLMKRIQARMQVYDDAFGPDDGQSIDIDEVHEPFAVVGK
jgi:hypothetical protein